MLEARAHVTGKDRQEIARDVLHQWALQEIDAASVAQKCLEREGLAAASAGVFSQRERAA